MATQGQRELIGFRWYWALDVNRPNSSAQATAVKVRQLFTFQGNLLASSNGFGEVRWLVIVPKQMN